MRYDFDTSFFMKERNISMKWVLTNSKVQINIKKKPLRDCVSKSRYCLCYEVSPTLSPPLHVVQRYWMVIDYVACCTLTPTTERKWHVIRIRWKIRQNVEQVPPVGRHQRNANHSQAIYRAYHVNKARVIMFLLQMMNCKDITYFK